MVLFLSRQTNVPPYDFLSLGKAFEGQGYTPLYHVRKLSKRTVLRYVGHVVKEIYYLARCRLCFLDRYDPVTCLLDFKYEPVRGQQDGLYHEYPVEPIIIQLWHAFGAYKCFGYQSADTSEGLSRKTLRAFRVHRNYSWIICTGEQARKPFSEAFAYPLDRVLNLGRPEYYLLTQEKDAPPKDAAAVPTVLFAPTLRYDKAAVHPFHALYDGRAQRFASLPADMVWSFHPLENAGTATGAQYELLSRADYVITDYSSIVYEAFLLGKKVLFYVPDIEEYRIAPGLNVDPEQEAPALTTRQDDELYELLEGLITGAIDYPQDALEKFIGDTFDAKPSLSSLLAFLPSRT